MVQKVTRTIKSARLELKRRIKNKDFKSEIYKIKKGRYVVGTSSQARDEFSKSYNPEKDIIETDRFLKAKKRISIARNR